MSIYISKILCPTDFSELSLLALRYGREFAEQFKAQLHCIHVVDESQQAWAALGPEAAPIVVPTEDVLNAASERMQSFFDAHLVGMTYVPITNVIAGRPFVEIVRYAKEKTCDLIIIATHGRGGVMHALMGSVAEKVVRKAPCPVLTVRGGEHEFVMP